MLYYGLFYHSLYCLCFEEVLCLIATQSEMYFTQTFQEICFVLTPDNPQFLAIGYGYLEQGGVEQKVTLIKQIWDRLQL